MQGGLLAWQLVSSHTPPGAHLLAPWTASDTAKDLPLFIWIEHLASVQPWHSSNEPWFSKGRWICWRARGAAWPQGWLWPRFPLTCQCQGFSEQRNGWVFFREADDLAICLSFARRPLTLSCSQLSRGSSRSHWAPRMAGFSHLRAKGLEMGLGGCSH